MRQHPPRRPVDPAGGGGGAGGPASGAGGFEELADELTGIFARGVDAPLDDDAFDDLATRVFRHQYAVAPVYRAFCDGRGATPSSVDGWLDIPAVPTSAFKRLRLLSVPHGRVEAVFRTSGTTRGSERRGEHHVADLGLYRAAALPNLAAHLIPEAVADAPGAADLRIPMLCLLPSPTDAPDSSLSAMMGFAMERWAGAGSGWLVDADRGLRVSDTLDALARAEDAGAQVLVAGTAFSFVHLLETMAAEGRNFRLPAGTRIMETGGFKGRSRHVSRERLYDDLEGRLGVPVGRIVNEYGMTELLSQFWEPVLRAGGPAAPGERRHVAPPWVRTRALDPRTLVPLPPGEAGLLCHLDLANLGSVACVLTEDLGAVDDAGALRLLGRAGGAEPRGCSLAMEELMEAAGGG